MPLIIAPLNVILKVIKILLDDKTKKHLESLEFTNQHIKILLAILWQLMLVIY